MKIVLGIGAKRIPIVGGAAMEQYEDTYTVDFAGGAKFALGKKISTGEYTIHVLDTGAGFELDIPEQQLIEMITHLATMLGDKLDRPAVKEAP